MEIKDHKIVGGKFHRSPNRGAALKKPTLLVMHFTGSGGDTGIGDVNYLSEKGRASAHIVVGRSGDITQLVEFNVIAHHAGDSSWRGVQWCNSYSIGIEMDNWGGLKKDAAGNLKSWTGVKINPEDAIEAFHKNGSKEYAYWEEFPEKQLVAALDLVSAILKAYPSITEIVGHDDVAPRRKVDPGPAFPLRRFQALLDRSTDSGVVTRVVNASALKLREAPNLTCAQIGTLRNSEKVTVIFDNGEWSQVKTAGGKVGWAFNQYLT